MQSALGTHAAPGFRRGGDVVVAAADLVADVVAVAVVAALVALVIVVPWLLS